MIVFVGTYVTGRRNRFRTYKVHIVLRRVDLAISVFRSVHP